MDRDVRWPNGARLAIAVSVMFEAYAEGKDPKNPVVGNHARAGIPDQQSLTYVRYASESGVWRLIHLLDRTATPATFCVSGRCAELFPGALAQIIRSGHDIAAHGYTQDVLSNDLDRESERALISRALTTLEAATGVKPAGWLSPHLSWSPNTDELLVEQGVVWRGDANYIDLPRKVAVANGAIAHVPHSEYTDNRVLGLSSQQLVDHFRRTFDYLYEREPHSLLVLTLHCQQGGRASVAAAFDELFRYFHSREDVWFARHRELAQWALAHPAGGLTNAERFFGQEHS